MVVCATVLCLLSNLVCADQTRTCQELIPEALGTKLLTGHGVWKVAELPDLSRDDRQLWIKAHGRLCPGVARGKFNGSTAIQYAVVLWTPGTPKHVKLIHAAPSATGGYRITSLFEGESARLPVVRRMPPGDYYGAEDRKTPIHIKTDVIYLETIEAGTTAFYFADGMFKQIVVSM